MFGRARRRSRTRQTAAGPEISIPAKLHLFMFLFLSVWLVLWGLTEFLGVRTLLTDPKGFLIVWSIVWTMGGALALYICAWMIAGREIVSLQSGILMIKRTLFGHVRVRQFDLLHVSNLRVDPEPYDPEGPRAAALYGFRIGPIAFEYRGKTIRFADGVTEDEAHEIVALLNGAARDAF